MIVATAAVTTVSGTARVLDGDTHENEHGLAFVEAVDRADLHAIHGPALDAVLGDDVGHDTLLAPDRHYGRGSAA
jgi:hypothetical protein